MRSQLSMTPVCKPKRANCKLVSQVAVNPSNTEVTVATERIAQEKAEGESSKATSEKERQALVKGLPNK